MTDPAESMLRYFAYDHLPMELQEVSCEFAQVAHRLVVLVPAGPERTAGLRKLLEAKDCAVRAALD